MNRLILYPKDETVFRSRCPKSDNVKFLFRSSHPVNIIICDSSEVVPEKATKKYQFNNYLCINNSLSIPSDWKTLAVHVINPSKVEKVMCEYEFRFVKKA